MPPAEVEALARRFNVDTFRPVEPPYLPNRYVTHVLNEGLTFSSSTSGRTVWRR